MKFGLRASFYLSREKELGKKKKHTQKRVQRRHRSQSKQFLQVLAELLNQTLTVNMQPQGTVIDTRVLSITVTPRRRASSAFGGRILNT